MAVGLFKEKTEMGGVVENGAHLGGGWEVGKLMGIAYIAVTYPALAVN